MVSISSFVIRDKVIDTLCNIELKPFYVRHVLKLGITGVIMERKEEV